MRRLPRHPIAGHGSSVVSQFEIKARSMFFFGTDTIDHGGFAPSHVLDMVGSHDEKVSV